MTDMSGPQTSSTFILQMSHHCLVTLYSLLALPHPQKAILL